MKMYRQEISQLITNYASINAQKHVPKELVKVYIATQFIGDGTPGQVLDGLPANRTDGSSSWRYRLCYERFGLANTGKYTKNDIIFVAANGNRRDAILPVINGELQGVYRNMLLAMQVDAIFVLDTKEHLEKTAGYNKGELLLAQFLEQNGYSRWGDTGLWGPVALDRLKHT
jgi:hypothetical protein